VHNLDSDIVSWVLRCSNCKVYTIHDMFICSIYDKHNVFDSINKYYGQRLDVKYSLTILI
jgi:rRNA maturation protein Nop10